MEEITPKLTVQDVLGYIIAYMCWLLTASLSMLTLLMVRVVLNVAWPILGGSRWVLRAVDRFGLVFLGLIWLVYVIFVEQYYRSGITAVRTRRVEARMRITPRLEQAQGSKVMRALRRLGLDILARRLVFTVGIPLIVLAVTYLVHQLLFRVLGG